LRHFRGDCGRTARIFASPSTVLTAGLRYKTVDALIRDLRAPLVSVTISSSEPRTNPVSISSGEASEQRANRRVQILVALIAAIGALLVAVVTALVKRSAH
jgi:hypothetical protein